MVWHGGISGSALIKAAEPGHLQQLGSHLEALPFQFSVFSNFNLLVQITVLLTVPLMLYWVGKRVPIVLPTALIVQHKISQNQTSETPYSNWIMKALGVLLLLGLFFSVQALPQGKPFFTPNHLNLFMLALGFLLHSSVGSYGKALDEASGGVSGILVQFPLYFGILGMMKESGLMAALSTQLVEVSSAGTFPFVVFLSAALANFFIPSGGGQWAIQGPIVVAGALHFKCDMGLCLLAFAFGDGLTNMLQPFWATPLLGITKLKAQEILPYSAMIFTLGLLVYSTMLLLFA
jgi:short-chain fatty acids transporter